MTRNLAKDYKGKKGENFEDVLNNDSQDEDSEFKNKSTYIPPHPKAPPKVDLPNKDDK
jgi:hypothetical protein